MNRSLARDGIAACALCGSTDALRHRRTASLGAVYSAYWLACRVLQMPNVLVAIGKKRATPLTSHADMPTSRSTGADHG
jgi:hypothetical protein